MAIPKSKMSANTAPAYDPPKKPFKSFVSADIVNAYAFVPVIMDIPNPEDWPIEKFSDSETRDDFLENNLVVAVGRLRGSDLLRYEQKYKRSIDSQMMRLDQIRLYNQAKFMLSAGEDAFSEEQLSNIKRVLAMVKYDEENNVFETDAGKVYGSYETNCFQLVGFILSSFGQILSMPNDNSSSWVLDSISEEEIIEKIQPDVLFSSEQDENGLTYWEWLLETSGIYKFSELKGKSEDDLEEVKEESPKNSPKQKSED